jgi:predicted 2-oxoglutarate/Fe(II)-dependent dioxygenase YbiX
MEIKDFVKVYNLIPKDVCEKIISDYQNDPRWEKHTWFAPTKDFHTQLHDKELEILYDQKLVSLVSYFDNALTKYYLDIKSNGLVTYCDAPRLNKYSTGTKMLQHFDLIRRNKEDGIPVISFIGVLNDDYVGGEFIMNGEVIKLKQGDVLMFPSTFLYQHEVTQVIKGTRYSVVSWGY